MNPNARAQQTMMSTQGQNLSSLLLISRSEIILFQCMINKLNAGATTAKTGITKWTPCFVFSGKKNKVNLTESMNSELRVIQKKKKRANMGIDSGCSTQEIASKKCFIRVLFSVSPQEHSVAHGVLPRFFSQCCVLFP